MSYRRVPFAIGEWYHCFTRGIDKRTTFGSEGDCRRFVQLLYLANDTKPIQRDNFYHLKHAEILRLPREAPLVSIGTYCLMRNHYHLLLQEIEKEGITKFMQKVGTGYAMYFNKKTNRIGNLFVKPFRSKHIHDDAYLRRVADYIHLNPAEKFERGWKKGKVQNFDLLEKAVRTYPFSSLQDFLGTNRVEGAILDREAVGLLKSDMPPLRRILKDYNEYYSEIERMY